MSDTSESTANGVAHAPLSPLDVMTLAQAAEYLQLPEGVVRVEASTGRLAGLFVGGDWRFVRADIVRWIRMSSPPPTPADPSAPWTPEKEAAVEAEIAELYARRTALGTVGDLQDALGIGE